MSNTDLIVGVLFLMFVVFITVKGQLPTYISLLF